MIRNPLARFFHFHFSLRGRSLSPGRCSRMIGIGFSLLALVAEGGWTGVGDWGVEQRQRTTKRGDRWLSHRFTPAVAPALNRTALFSVWRGFPSLLDDGNPHLPPSPLFRLSGRWTWFRMFVPCLVVPLTCCDFVKVSDRVRFKSSCQGSGAGR